MQRPNKIFAQELLANYGLNFAFKEPQDQQSKIFEFTYKAKLGCVGIVDVIDIDFVVEENGFEKVIRESLRELSDSISFEQNLTYNFKMVILSNSQFIRREKVIKRSNDLKLSDQKICIAFKAFREVTNFDAIFIESTPLYAFERFDNIGYDSSSESIKDRNFSFLEFGKILDRYF